MKNSKVFFCGVESDYLKDNFLTTLERFYPLHSHPIALKKKHIHKSTMQAQPIIDWNFFNHKKRGYAVHFREVTLIHPTVKVADLPKQVLQGWFAHELGHIIDYQKKTVWELINFGIKYLLYDQCTKEAEKMADYYAIRYGCKNEILAMKKFIIEHADIDEKYKERIQKYYPGPEEIEHMIINHEA